LKGTFYLSKNNETKNKVLSDCNKYFKDVISHQYYIDCEPSKILTINNKFSEILEGMGWSKSAEGESQGF
jgi:hypothetical protein